MKDFLKTNAGHVIGVALLLVFAVVGFRAWLKDHDAQVQVDKTVKAAQADEASLKKQQTANTATAAVQVAQLQRNAARVTTAKQAVAALPSVEIGLESAPLNATLLPDAPDEVAVDALPLYQDLNKCQQTGVLLNACTANLGLQMKVDADKDVEIKALKPSGWRRLGHGAKIVGCAAGGGLVGGYFKGGTGAAIGSGTGAALCQMF